MKRLIILVSILSGLLLTGGCAMLPKTGSETAAATTAAASSSFSFSSDDIKGDDNGAGSYTYPTDSTFTAKSFDLTAVSMKDTGTKLSITFTIPAEFKNDSEMAGGWDNQMFDVYFNLGTGKHKQTIAGRQVKITEGWDKSIVVSPEAPAVMLKEIADNNSEVGDDVSIPENLSDDISLADSVSVKGNTLTALVSKDKIGDLNKIRGIQVFVTSYDKLSPQAYTKNRPVLANESQWKFGGGTDFDGEPNVIDILGDNKALGNYKSDEGVAEFTSVSMIPIKK